MKRSRFTQEQIIGVLMFDAASAAVAAIDRGSGEDPAVLLSAIRNAVTAIVLILVMTTGLIIPKIAFDAVWSRRLRQADKP